MALVIDASVLAEVLVASPLGARAWRAFDQDRENLNIPHLAIAETASVLRKWSRRGIVSEQRALAALDDLLDLRVVRWGADPLLARVWELRDNLTVYDAIYVALAEALDATLLTADVRLAKAADGRARCRVTVVTADH